MSRNNRESLLDGSPLPVKKATLRFILFFIILFAAGSLLMNWYFSSGRNNAAPVGNEDTRANP